MDRIDFKLFSYFERVSPLCLDGEIAGMLLNGDVYEKSPFQNGKDAKEYALKLCERIMSYRYNEFVIFHSEKPWVPG
jgi:hypothetical protein